jgi:hypothetical protein
MPAAGVGPTGTVSFFNGTTLMGSVAVNGGTGGLSTSSLTVGPHSITASYSGDGNFSSSTSGALSQNVQQVSTTRVTSSLNPSIFG